MTHTPAPWIINERDLTIRSKSWGISDQMGDYQGCIVCDLKPALSGSDCDVEMAKRARAHAVAEMEANARLIAAAPELLNALKAIEIYAREPQDADWLPNILREARAAIAKAEGK